MLRAALVVLVFCFPPLFIQAQVQSLYTYQQLSGTYYAAQRDSLKKAWVCPEISTDRTVQKKFKELWDDRTSFLVESIDKQHFIYDPGLYGYLQGIINQILAASPQRFSGKPLLLIDRSSVVNAYALGSNVLIVNLGLICFAQTREELALSIAHELSHNILHHPENAMRETAEWLMSDEYKRSMKEIEESKYERYTRLKKVFQVYSFSRSKHQRYHESDADSLATVLLKSAHIPFRAEYFLRLDSADEQYRLPLKRPLNDYFKDYSLAVEDGWMQTRTRGLSTARYNFTDSSGIEDSLKTHPDCVVRYHKTLAWSDRDAATTPVPDVLAGRTVRMMIWNMYDNRSLTACLYTILREKDKGQTDGWYNFMLYSVLADLYFEDQKLNRFNAIDIKPKEYMSADYYHLQTMLEKIPSDNLRQFCSTLRQASFWEQRPADEKALGKFLTAISVTNDNPDKARRLSADEFVSSYSTSMYCEFVDQFRKK